MEQQSAKNYVQETTESVFWQGLGKPIWRVSLPYKQDLCFAQGGYSGINVTEERGGGGGVRRIFLGLKFSTPV